MSFVHAAPNSTELPEPRRSPLATLPARSAILFALFAAEVLILSLVAETTYLKEQGGFPEWLATVSGPALRIAIAVSAAALIFVFVRSAHELRRLSASLSPLPLSKPFLAGHSLLLAALLPTAPLVFESTSPDTGTLLALWVLAFLIAASFAVLALFPFAAVLRIFAVTRPAWIYGVTIGTCAHLTGLLSALYWRPSTAWTLRLVASILQPFVPNLTVDPAENRIGASGFEVEIASGCSGLEGVSLMFVFGLGASLLVRNRRSRLQAFALVPFGMVLIWILNAIRIAGLVAVGYAGAPNLALGGFHSQAGWIAFNAVAAGLIVAASRQPSKSLARASENPTAPYLLPFLALLGAGMLSHAASDGFEWLYPLRPITVLFVLAYYREVYLRLDWGCGRNGILAGIAVFLLWIATGHFFLPATNPDLESGLELLSPPFRLAWIAIRVLAASLTVPIAEELAFRGFLHRRLLSTSFQTVPFSAFSLPAIAVSSLAFGLLHGGQWIAGALAGALFALAMIRGRRFGDAVLAHAVANALLAVWVLATGSWQYW